jgi:sialic acid synthase SpsE
MAYSHDGSVALAQTIVNAAADAGADAVSIHITHMPDYMVRHYGSGPGRVSAGKEERSIYEYIVEISLDFDAWREVAQTATQRGLDLIVMPNDGASLAFAESLEPAAYVISAASFEELEFIERIGALGRPVYLRVGGATLGEIETVIERLRAGGNERITLLYGHQNYPTKIADTNLRFLTCLRETFGLPVGIADHIDAADDFATIGPLLAIPLGAVAIEKHVTHDRALRGEDFESALGPAELTAFIARVRKAETALGRRYAEGLSESSRAYRANSRKRLVAARDIAPGETLDAEAVVAKRSDSGCSPARRDEIVGARARRPIARDEGIEPAMLEPAR